VGLIAALAATPFLLPGEPAKPKREVPSSKQVVGYINHQRQIRHLKRLRIGGRLTTAARSWSRRLALTDSFFHAALSTGSTFSWIAETLYRGPNGPVRPWLMSPPHRAILLAQRARLIGVARSGSTWVARLGAR
jgi:uncharacterized protein YkwD